MAGVVSEGALRNLLRAFPHKSNYAFAYGSAVFSQRNQKPGKMIDLVFVVDNPVEWHTENIQMNGSHYSFLKYFGPGLISSIQERMASGVYYNPYVRVDGQLLKYGVISTNALEKDLSQWTHIYIAGRLHKPVLDLKGPISANLLRSLVNNRESALRAVLLQEGRYISKFSLYHGITELSYLGDSRMKLAENPNKTKNIVTPLMQEFDRIYNPLIDALHPFVEINTEGLLVQDTTPQVRFKHLMALPNLVQISLSRQLFRDPRLFDIEEVMAELSYMPTLRTYIRNSISEVVWGSSILQTIQGLMSAGVVRSVRYALEKLKKGREVSGDISDAAHQKASRHSLPDDKDNSHATSDSPSSADREDQYDCREQVKQRKQG